MQNICDTWEVRLALDGIEKQMNYWSVKFCVKHIFLSIENLQNKKSKKYQKKYKRLYFNKDINSICVSKKIWFERKQTFYPKKFD